MSEIVLAEDQHKRELPDLKWRIARVISWAGHPLVFVSATLATVVICRLANRVGVAVLVALILTMILPTALLLIRGVRSGRWSDADVSVHSERAEFYPPAILLSLGGVAALLVLRAPGFIMRGALVTLVLLLVAAVINRRLKVSLHAMFAFYCAIALFRIGWVPGIVSLILAALVFWSRLHLRRHGLADLVVGCLLGSLGALVAAWLP